MEEKEMTGGQVSGADAMEKDNQLGQEKTYTQAEFDKALLAETDKRVNQALENKKAEWEKDYSERLKAEKDEAARLAKMSADERAKAEFDKRVKDFEDREAKHNAERLEFECTKQLAGEKLPVEFASMLTGADAEATKANIETFKTAFSKAIEDAVTEKLKGTTPKVGEGQSDAWLDSVRKGAGLK